jgi:hypothetical protein
VFPLSFASQIGLDPLRMPVDMTLGVGVGSVHTYYADIEIGAFYKSSGAPQVKFSFRTTVGFTAGLDAQGFGLLGGIGFFENYAVTFDRKNGVFHVEVP